MSSRIATGSLATLAFSEPFHEFLKLVKHFQDSMKLVEGRAAQEFDDLEMIAYMLMYARGNRPFVGSVTEMIAKRKELHQNPGNMVRGNNGSLKRPLAYLSKNLTSSE
ncbi:unnamed protein product [Caenorhabditis brenneri]